MISILNGGDTSQTLGLDPKSARQPDTSALGGDALMRGNDPTMNYLCQLGADMMGAAMKQAANPPPMPGSLDMPPGGASLIGHGPHVETNGLSRTPNAGGQDDGSMSPFGSSMPIVHGPHVETNALTRTPNGGGECGAAKCGDSDDSDVDSGYGSDSDSSSGKTDLENGMDKLEHDDPNLFNKMEADAKKGDGNALVKDELKAKDEGAFTQSQCEEAVEGAQELANAHGGGKINNEVKDEAKKELGKDLIHGGDTRAGHIIKKAVEDFTCFGAIAKGIEEKNSPKHESILDAGQSAMQGATDQAMQAMQQASPEIAAKYQWDKDRKDGKAMVEDLIAANQANPDVFGKQQADTLATQVGDAGAGKVNDKAKQAYAKQFGDSDALFQGSSKISKDLNKFEDGFGKMESGLVSPITKGIDTAEDLAKGDLKAAGSDLKGAVVGAAEDAAMLIPGAGPEVLAAETAGRVGIEAGEAGASAGARAGTDAAASGASKGGDISDIANRADDINGRVNDAINALNGNGNSNNNDQV